MTDENTTININEADLAMLMQLPGIGAVLARRIIEHRETHPFTRVEDLTAVEGMTVSMVAAIADKITVGIPEEAITMKATPSVDSLPEEVPLPEPDEASVTETPTTQEAPSSPDETPPDEPLPPPPTTSPPNVRDSQSERRAQRRGCGVLVISVLLGTILGAAIPLVTLFILNGGTLTFARNNDQIQRDIINIQATQESLDGQLQTLNSGIATIDSQATRIDDFISAIATQQGRIALDLSETQGNVTNNQERLTAVSDQIATAEANFESVVQAANTFDTFVTGLQELMGTLPQAASMTPTPFEVVPTVSITPGSATPQITPTLVTATPTTLPTRTPRPTATPIPALPTPTP